MVSGRPRLRPLALVAMLLAAANATADYKQSFRKGIEAIDLQDWAGAARHMREAAAEQPREGERVRIVAVRFEIYLPHYYLGLALYHTGDCAGALRAWETSEEQGRIMSAPDEYAILKGLRDECRRRTSAAEPVTPGKPPAPSPPFPTEELRRAQAGLARAAEAEAAVTNLRRDPDVAAVWLDRPALGSRADAAIGKIATASGWVKAASGQGDAAQLTRATALTTEAIGELEAVRQEVEARRDELQRVQARPIPTTRPQAPLAPPLGPAVPAPGAGMPAAEDARRTALRREVGTLTAEARSALGEARARPASAELDGVRRDLEQALVEADRTNPMSPPADLERVRDRIARSMPRLRQIIARSSGAPGHPAPPAELRAAVEAFLGSNYLRTVDILAKQEFAEARASAVALLLRGAARYALYLESGKSDDTLLRAADADVRACRRVVPALTPDAAFFSPAYSEFFRRAR
ncbi:MAG: hypothetical protein LAO05_11750 [Acidobacteriia bacterium]|nr:hypothetical protein [Terriglobia bacterium]